MLVKVFQHCLLTFKVQVTAELTCFTHAERFPQACVQAILAATALVKVLDEISFLLLFPWIH